MGCLRLKSLVQTKAEFVISLEYITFVQSRPFHDVSKVREIGYKLQAVCIPFVVITDKTGGESQLKCGCIKVSRGFLLIINHPLI